MKRTKILKDLLPNLELCKFNKDKTNDVTYFVAYITALDTYDVEVSEEEYNQMIDWYFKEILPNWSL